MSVCVCVSERERQRDRERQRETERESARARANVMNARIFRPLYVPCALSKWGAINNILFVIIITIIKFASIKCRVESVHFSEVPCPGSWFPHASWLLFFVGFSTRVDRQELRNELKRSTRGVAEMIFACQLRKQPRHHWSDGPLVVAACSCTLPVFR